MNLTALGRVIWEDRYALKDEKGNLIEKNIEDTFRRVAKFIASKEKEPQVWEDKFYEIMSQGYFCPAGRVLAHSGTTNPQLFNCFVLPFEDDSLESIMTTNRNMAVTQKFSGGCIGGESLVLTDRGPVSIKDIVENVNEKYKVLSFNEKTKETEYSDILDRHITQLSGDRVFEISFDNSKSGVSAKMRASDWHPFFVFDGEKIIQVRADELKPGMAVIGSTALKSGYDRWGWLLGYIAGDGAIDKNGKDYTRIRIVDDSEVCVKRASEAMGVPYKPSKDKRYKVGMWCCEAFQEIAEKIKQEYGGYQTCSTKSVPGSIWNGSPEKKLSFLAGYLDADGWFNRERNRFEVFTVSESLAKGVIALAGSLGIRTTYRLRKARKENESDGWEIRILSSPYITAIISVAGLKYRNLETGWVTGIIDFSHKWKDRLITAGIDIESKEAWRDKIEIDGMDLSVSYWLQHKKATRETAAAILRECGETLLANAVLSSQRVLSSVPTEKSETLYDLTVDKNQTYIASDPEAGAYVVIHNTGFNASPLRPAGSYIKGVNGHSCGVMGFLHMMSTTSEVIEQGGCLTEDTLVTTKKGLLYFKELVATKEQGWYPQDLVLKTKDGDNSSKRYYVNGFSDIVKIQTDLGVEIKGTHSHKLFVFTLNGFKWKEFKDIKVGDYIVSKMDQYEGQQDSPSLCTSVKKSHHNCVVPEKLPEVLDNKFAFFLGYYLGNGFSGSGEHDYRNGVTIPDISYLNNKITGIYEDLFGPNISVSEIKKEDDKSRTYYVTNKIIKEYLKNNGLLKTKSITACLPRIIRESPRGVVGSFLSGLFEADGSLCHGYPQLSTSSVQLAKEIQILLLNLGIPCKKFKTKRSKSCFSKKDIYCVKIISFKGLENWNKIVNPSVESRFYSKNFKPDLSREKNYVLPYAEYWLKKAHEVLLSVKGKTDEIKYLLKSVRRYLRGDRKFTLSAYEYLNSKECLKGVLPPVDNNLFLKAESVSYDEDHAYDMEVEKSHSYIANSLVSHNSRRGASMGLLEVWHPDIWEFISYKNNHNWDRLLEFMDVKDWDKWEEFKFENLYKLQMFNISVGITDEFLEAVKNGDDWPFLWDGKEWKLYKVIFKKKTDDGYVEKEFEVTADCDKTAIWKLKKYVPYPRSVDIFEVVSKRVVKASELWEALCYNAWADGCPGIINLSTARRMHNLEYISPLIGTNPCGEQLLPGYGSCNLSSIILSSFVNDHGIFDYGKLSEVVKVAIRFGDNIIDNCLFPLKEIEEKALKERRVGLGTMGIHDVLIKMKKAYDSEEGRLIVEKILRIIRDEAYKASIELAEEKGTFPYYDRDKFMETGFIKTLPEDIRKKIYGVGIRNGTLLTQAPTGTIGTMLNVSTGCEPWFALSIQRNTRLGSYEDGCSEYIKWRKSHISTIEKPDYFKTSQEIAPEGHIKMLTLFTLYIDSSVSKCIVEGTKIQTSCGIMPVEKMSNVIYNQPDTFSDVNNNYKVYDENGSLKKVVKQYYGGIKPCFSIRFNNGIELTTAYTHLFKTEKGWKNVVDISIGDKIFYRFKRMETRVGLVPINPPDFYKNIKREFPSYYTKEYAEFLGMWLADGSVNKHVVSVCKRDDVVIERLQFLIKHLFNIDSVAVVDKRNGLKICSINSTAIADFFKKNYGNNSLNKIIPEEIFRSPQEVQICFLNGLSLDGYKNRSKFVIYEGYSSNIARGTVSLLAGLGVRYYFGKKYVKTGKKAKWTYSAAGYFEERILCPIELHKQNYSLIQNKNRQVYIDKSKIDFKDIKKGEWHLKRNFKKSISKKSFTSKNLLNKLGIEVDENLSFVTVTSKEFIGNKKVYDIEVEDTHSYLIDGIVSHNTINMPNESTVEDVSEAFMMAMENGAKGVTVFRDGCKAGVLINKDKKGESKDNELPDPITSDNGDCDSRMYPIKRGNRTIGATYRVHMQKHNLYVIANKNKDGKLVEIFTTVGESKKPNAHHTSGVEDSWAEGIAKIISLALRAGVDPYAIIRNLKNIPSDKPVFTTIGDCETSEPIPSPPHAIARVMEEEMKYGVIQDKKEEPQKSEGICNECGSYNIKWNGPNCYQCLDCLYNGCS